MIMRIWHFIRYVFIFIKALVVANYQVAKLVLSPKLNIKPGFLAVEMEATSDFEVTSLANSITLTPGTIAVHIADGRNTIVIHALHTDPHPDAVRKDVKETLETNILKWTRPAGVPTGGAS